MTTLTPTRKTHDTDGESGTGRPWNVIVLNDNHNTFDGVARALSSTLPAVSFEKGLKLADAIHNSGRAVVWSGHKETAELYWDQLKGLGLTMGPLEST